MAQDPFTTVDLGRLDYHRALERQRACLQEVVAGRRDDGEPGPMYVLLVEHDPPVITVSRRKSAREHLVADPERLAAAGVEVAETDRGGDITYHGPGQLVVYPILDLNVLGLRLHGYMRFLEQVVIDCLADWQVTGYRDDDATGVWVGDAPGRKICAMGVRVSRWVTMHGLALNVTTDLSHFDFIVPCGLVDRSVTSLARECGDAAPPMAEVRTHVVDRLRTATLDRIAARCE